MPSTATDVFRGIGAALGTVAPLVPAGPWSVVLSGLGAASNLLASLLDHGIEPGEAIAIWQSVVPDVHAANARIDDLIAERSRGSHPEARRRTEDEGGQ